MAAQFRRRRSRSAAVAAVLAQSASAGLWEESVHLVPSHNLYECLGLSSSGASVGLLDCELPSPALLRWNVPPWPGSSNDYQADGSWPASNDSVEGYLQLEDSVNVSCLAASVEDEGAIVLTSCRGESTRWHYTHGLQLQPTSRPHLCLTRQSSVPTSFLPVEGEPGTLTLANCTGAPEKSGNQWLALPSNTLDVLGAIQPPLRVKGRYIVDASGVRVKLTGPNWVGAHLETRVNGGMLAHPIRKIAKLIRRIGFNHVRMNYAVQMLHDSAPVPAEMVIANPEFAGLTPLEIFDRCIEALTDEHLLVVINAHTSDYRWCCSLTDEQALWWNSRFSEQDWLDSLRDLAERYGNNSRVVGYDLRNEPRVDWPQGSQNPTLVWWDPIASWGKCERASVTVASDLRLDLGQFSTRGFCLAQHTANLRLASEQGSYAVWHGDPDALVFVEGTGAADLASVLDQPMQFQQPCLHSRVVWSVHDYHWVWRWYNLADLIRRGSASFAFIFETLSNIRANRGGWSVDNHEELRDKAWGYLLNEGLAPVWVGELGGDGSIDTGDNVWANTLFKYMDDKDVEWAYWPLDGVKYPPGIELHDGGSYVDSAQKLPESPLANFVPDRYGLVNENYTAARDPIKLYRLARLSTAKVGPGVNGAPPASGADACMFDPGLHPIEGTGEHPVGLAGYARVQLIDTCEGARDQGRRVFSGGGARALVVEQDRQVAADFSSMERSLCTRDLVESIQDDKQARFRDLASLVASPNPIEQALRSENSSETTRKLLEQVHEFQRLLHLFWWSLLLPAAALLVLVLMRARLGENQWLWERLQASLRCKVLLDEGCSYKKASVLKGVLCSSRIAAGAGSLVLVIVLLVLLVFGFLGRKRAWDGSDVLACSFASFCDEVLSGGDFVGLLPALSAFDDIVVDLSHGGNLRESLEAISGNISVLKCARVVARSELATLREALAQPGAECAVGAEPLQRTIDAQSLLENSMASALTQVGESVEGIGGSSMDVLEGDLDSFLVPLRDVKDVMVSVMKVFSSRATLDALGQVHVIALHMTWVILVLVTPTLVCGSAAAARLLCNRVDEGCCAGGLHKGCPKPRVPLFARLTWILALLYSAFAFLIAILLQAAVTRGAGFCIVLDELTSDGIGEYTNGLGLPSSHFARGTAVLLFETCFTEGGSGRVLDVVSFDGCSGNKTVATSDDLRGRLDAFTHELQEFFSAVDELAGTQTLGRTEEMRSLVAALDAIDAAAAEACPGLENASLWCPALPPTVMPGLCTPGELAARARDWRARLRSSCEGVDAATQSFTQQGLRRARELTQTLGIDKIRLLLDGLDCGKLGSTARGLVDAACAGILSGYRTIYIVHFGLGIASLGLAVIQYMWWRPVGVDECYDDCENQVQPVGVDECYDDCDSRKKTSSAPAWMSQAKVASPEFSGLREAALASPPQARNSSTPVHGLHESSMCITGA